MATVIRADRIEGFLQVGLCRCVASPQLWEVVVNFPATVSDKEHHVIFSPNQARNLAELLLKKADEAEAEPATLN